MPAKQYTLTAGNSATPPDLAIVGQDRYELFYGYLRGTDGHGGPYHDLTAAQDAAAARLRGCRTMLYVEIRLELPQGGWRTVQKLTKSEAQQ
jgi:hypothetical protein